jgi:hypothetical protein
VKEKPTLSANSVTEHILPLNWTWGCQQLVSQVCSCCGFFNLQRRRRKEKKLGLIESTLSDSTLIHQAN